MSHLSLPRTMEPGPVTREELWEVDRRAGILLHFQTQQRVRAKKVNKPFISYAQFSPNVKLVIYTKTFK